MCINVERRNGTRKEMGKKVFGETPNTAPGTGALPFFTEKIGR